MFPSNGALTMKYNIVSKKWNMFQYLEFGIEWKVPFKRRKGLFL